MSLGSLIPRGLFKKLALIAFFWGCLSGCPGDGSRSLIALEYSHYDLTEFSSATVSVQYRDEEGYPIQGGSVLFAIEGDGNGATMDTLAMNSDSQGKASTELNVKKEAEFNIRVKAEFAIDLLIPVTVGVGNGGELQVEVFDRSTTKLTSAEVILTNPLNCAVFDPLMVPSGTSNAEDATKTISLSSSGADVTFTGLVPGAKYTVVAIGKTGDQVAAKACADGLEMTQEAIDHGTPLTQTLYLEDFSGNVAGNRVLLETKFLSSIRFDRVGALFNSMSDENNDPLKYFVETVLDSNSTLGMYLTAWKSSLINYLSNNISQNPQNRSKLQQVATKCKSVQNVRFFSMLSFPDTITKNEPFESDHEVKYVVVEMLGGEETFYFKENMRIMGQNATNVIIKTKATMKIDGALRLTIDKHTLSLPLVDAFLGQILWDTFGKSDLSEILRPMIPCPQIGQLTKQFYIDNIDPESVYIAELVLGAMTEACEAFTADLPMEIYNNMIEDIRSTGITETLGLEGSCTLEFLNDGKTISKVTDGSWIGIGTFTGKRP